MVHCVYTFGISCPLTEFCHVHNSLCVHLCTIAQVSRAISSQLRHLSTIGKKLGDFLGPAFRASRVQHVSDLHFKFALRPHHV